MTDSSGPMAVLIPPAGLPAQHQSPIPGRCSRATAPLAVTSSWVA